MTERRFVLTTLSRIMPLVAGCALLAAASAHAETDTCDHAGALGVARTVEIDTSAGGIYGALSTHAAKTSLLGKKEVVLTFDDGPMPWITRSILETLDKECTKATFFSVGRMGVAYPEVVREVMARGHTLGTHTYSHPFNMPRMKAEKAQAEIENGFAAVAAAAGQPIAPFFRFPGLADSSALISYLGSRGMAAFTVDIVSNDSYIHSASELTRRTVAAVEAHKGGIVLFHDIKGTTAKALPGILAKLKDRGYTVVHFKAKAPAEPKVDLLAGYAQRIEKAIAAKTPGTKVPFYGSTGPIAKGTEPVTPDGDTTQAAAGNDEAAQMPAFIRGGLDLSQRTNEEHPAVSAFPGGIPMRGDEPAGFLQGAKGAIWDSLHGWTPDGLHSTPQNTPATR